MFMANASGALLWKYCTELLESGAGYVWGARGEKYTQAEAEYLHSVFKTGTYDKTYYFDTSMKRWKDKIVVDCSGLIQGFRRKHYDGKDTTANGLFAQCDETGTIDTIPTNERGVLIFRKDSNGKMGHVGVYGGDGTTIEAMNSKKGVVKQNLNKTRWTHWGIPAWLDTETVKEEDDDDEVITKTPALWVGSVTGCHMLNVRREASTKGQIYKTLKAGEIVSIYEERGNWVRINPNAQYWVSKKYITELPKLVVAKCFVLTIRNAPNTKGKKLGYLKAGSTVYKYGVAETGWYKIGPDERYISNKYALPYVAKELKASNKDKAVAVIKD